MLNKARQNKMLHHYTSISTLALILDSRKIRFNRLTNVDDVSESNTFGKYSLAPFLYVSCWTDSDKESIPLWHLYTDKMRGVRISFDDQPFFYRDLPEVNPYDVNVIAGTQSPLTIDQMIGNNYFVMPSFINKENFGAKVNYVKDIEGIYEDAVQFTENNDGTFNVKTHAPHTVAIHKSDVWAFQEEYRYTLYVMPSPPEGGNAFTNPHQFSNYAVNCLYRSEGPEVEYIDVDLDPKALEKMIVTLGPLTTYADEIMVRSLLDKYCRSAHVNHSVLRGSIRSKP